MVGYLAVSRPFLNLSTQRFFESTHDARMMVSVCVCMRVCCVCGVILIGWFHYVVLIVMYFWKPRASGFKVLPHIPLVAVVVVGAGHVVQ